VIFGRGARLEAEIERLERERALMHGDLVNLSCRVSALEAAIGRALDVSNKIAATTILVGDTRVSLDHAVQVLADAHDMQAVERHLRIKHHRQGDVQGRAINEW
jgi:hypothetical protein